MFFAGRLNTSPSVQKKYILCEGGTVKISHQLIRDSSAAVDQIAIRALSRHLAINEFRVLLTTYEP
jgi:hypothetical protein